MERCLTQHLTSHVPLGWVDGELQPLFMVVHRPGHQDQGSGMKDMHGDNDEVHWVPLVFPPSTHMIPEFYITDGGRTHKCNRSVSIGTEKILMDRDFLDPIGSRWRTLSSACILMIPICTLSWPMNQRNLKPSYQVVGHFYVGEGMGPLPNPHSFKPFKCFLPFKHFVSFKHFVPLKHFVPFKHFVPLNCCVTYHLSLVLLMHYLYL